MTGQLAIAGIPQPARVLGQYWTPPKLALRIASAFPFAGDVLEPTAGVGNLAEAVARRNPLSFVHAVELDARLLPRLQGKGVSTVTHADFLASREGVLAGRFAWSVSNVPDASKKGIHAIDFLERLNDLCDENVALCRTNVLHSDTRHRRLWSRTHIRKLCPLVNRPAFDEDGGKQEWSVIWFGREPRPFEGIEHWEGSWS